ncbi:phosphonate C-P lyase system protein PhnH [Zavarzinia compransoris]|uniref:Phosphonate C-P lyase system protein PhnH n=1 Tax=Zavarzinia compransoris TaxID=1264899 RepID=A0A317E9T7_9PROT|nr:phosphonate C-P lyase system protein PhnH [Zavarzinia compransoris]PWR23322.1 phosphonate C-P lyase system protein PhnH [Zavarzinia compransoris]TDP46106.1 alpha-D-ribose 1-methylphosphonate 5-triphosphate synthase subunit PhnH [Zavarzinia compransoris]
MSDTALIAGLDAGFADAALQSQACFRAVLQALARPGRIETLARPAAAPAGLSPAAASVLATLADLDTPVFLAPGYAGGAVAGFVTAGLGAPLAAAGAAAFALVPAADLLPLDRFAAGSDAYPDRAATVIVEVAALGAGPALTLAGPGINGSATLAVTGLPAAFAAAWNAQRAGFPLGVDLVFCCGERVAALPRSTRLL